jgi:hypothetical protein
MIKLIQENLPIVEPQRTENFSVADGVRFVYVLAVWIFATPDIRDIIRFRLRQVFHWGISGIRRCVTDFCSYFCNIRCGKSQKSTDLRFSVKPMFRLRQV